MNAPSFTPGGMCSLHYNRWQRTGDPGPATYRGERFPPGDLWARVDKNGPGGCWLWIGAIKKGYGRYQTRQAHRLIYELLVGPIAADLDLDHLCRVRACVNPAHLEPVTRRENLARSSLPFADALRNNTCMRGHDFTPENTYVAPKKPRTRRCRTCEKARAQRIQEARQLKRTA